VAPRGTATKQPGGCIYNQTGELVWSAAAQGYEQTMQFAVEQYHGQSVITMWQGAFNAAGYGNGYNLLLDSQYKVSQHWGWQRGYEGVTRYLSFPSQVIANV
jgi:hypothetical protein